ncbi:HEAT repeat domain-containing protein [Candidatus Poribacteria bacterium]|nr:HEAT repeat domain-containing protein [Candidatus Poribacteria bacterium]
MKKKVCRIVLTIFIVLVFAVASYNNFADAEAVTLKYNLKVGDLLTYQMKMSSRTSMAGMPGEIPMDSEGIRTQVVTQVSKEGVYSLLIVERSEITRAITSVGRIEMSSERQKMGPDGSILEPSPLAEDPLIAVLAFAGKLPVTPVKKGESWKQKVKISAGDSLDLQWTLAGFQKIKDYDSAHLNGSFTAPIPLKGGTITVEAGKFTHFFAVKEGITVVQKGELKMKSTPPPGVKEAGSSTISFTLELMKKEALPPPQLQKTVAALELIESGQAELRKGNYDVAKAQFEEVLTNYPEISWRKDVEALMTKVKAAERLRSLHGLVPHEPSDQEVDKLIQQLKDRDVNVRVHAARWLGSPRHKQAVEPLIAALKDQSIDVRTAAAEALGLIGDQRAVEPLIAALKGADADVRLSTAKALGRLGDQRAIPQLERVAKEDNIASVRHAAQHALEELRHQQ